MLNMVKVFNQEFCAVMMVMLKNRIGFILPNFSIIYLVHQGVLAGDVSNHTCQALKSQLNE